MTAPRLPILSLLETRILGVLHEKQHTVPDTYSTDMEAEALTEFLRLSIAPGCERPAAMSSS